MSDFACRTEDTHKSASIYTVKYNGVLKSDNNAEGPDPTVLGKRFVKGGEAEEDNTRTVSLSIVRMIN